MSQPAKKHWHGWWTGLPGIIVNLTAATAGQAKQQIFRQVRAANYKAQFTDIRVRRGDLGVRDDGK